MIKKNKYINLLILSLFLFTACSTKSNNDVKNNNSSGIISIKATNLSYRKINEKSQMLKYEILFYNNSDQEVQIMYIAPIFSSLTENTKRKVDRKLTPKHTISIEGEIPVGNSSYSFQGSKVQLEQDIYIK
ncbi:hypothetical protein AMQ83_11690 [Paenibacillus riograndensis]|nr:hypothetical protein AMQ83_11690 [Paenibacillus riograndensis]